MNCAVMQPNYFPWAGYFNLINKADTFVFLDDAQFSKSNWHNRNSILVKQKKIWITVPLKKSKLKIGGNFINSSQINVDKKRTDKIIEILTNLKATNYFSPLGAEEYLTKDNFKKKNKY